MNDGKTTIPVGEYWVLLFAMSIIGLGFFLGYIVGEEQWKKPCDQFTKWEYQLGYIPYKCAPEFKEVNE